MRDVRRLDLLWSGAEITEYELLVAEAMKVAEELPEYVKKILHSHLQSRRK